MVELVGIGSCHVCQFKLLGVVLFLELSQEIKVGELLDRIKKFVHGSKAVILFHELFVTDI